jgi:hypothetical protein
MVAAAETLGSATAGGWGGEVEEDGRDEAHVEYQPKSSYNRGQTSPCLEKMTENYHNWDNGVENLLGCDRNY